MNQPESSPGCPKKPTSRSAKMRAFDVSDAGNTLARAFEVYRCATAYVSLVGGVVEDWAIQNGKKF